jgi:two-component system response regulator NreC
MQQNSAAQSEITFDRKDAMAINILIVDDHRLFRQGLGALFSTHSNINVIGEAGDGHTAISQAKKLKPDIVLMDINMPVLNGIEATRQLKAEISGIKVIALSMHSGREFVQKMLSAGCSGYLLKDCHFDELVEAISHVNSGKSYISPSLAGTLIEDYLLQLTDRASLAQSAGQLSQREREVLQLIAEGWATANIANKLCISVKTVETHRSNIMKKLSLFTVAELTKYALAEGITFLHA